MDPSPRPYRPDSHSRSPTARQYRVCAYAWIKSENACRTRSWSAPCRFGRCWFSASGLVKEKSKRAVLDNRPADARRIDSGSGSFAEPPGCRPVFCELIVQTSCWRSARSHQLNPVLQRISLVPDRRSVCCAMPRQTRHPRRGRDAKLDLGPPRWSSSSCHPTIRRYGGLLNIHSTILIRSAGYDRTPLMLSTTPG